MTTLPASAFGALLKRFRANAGLTQEELAMAAGLSVEAVSALERGTRQAPRKETVQLLASALGLAPQEAATLESAARRRGVASSPVSGALPNASAGDQPAIVGRVAELAALDRHLAGNGPPVLFLLGEPGIGKTALLREATLRAGMAGWSVLQGGCYAASHQNPYMPLLQAMRARIQGQPTAQLRKDLAHCAALSILLPELAEMFAVPPALATILPEQQRGLMFAAVTRFLANVAGPAGTLLVLDDLQWVGADALDLLASLLHATAGAPLRVVAAYRDVEVTPRHPLATAVAHLARAGLGGSIKLGPLATEDSAALLAALIEGGESEAALRERVLRRAGGVPFYLVSCAQGLRAGALPGGADEVPWDVAETIRQRVAALPEAAREALETAAVAGRAIGRSVLVTVAARAGRGEDEVLLAIDAASGARLLAEEGEEDYTFAHNIVREVIVGDLSAARRAAIHLRIAEALEREAGELPAEALAYHYIRCGKKDRAAVFLERVADRAWQMHANAAAEDAYRELVGVLDALGRAPDAALARVRLGSVLRVLGRYDEALELLERAAEALRVAGDEEGRRQALAQLGRVHARRGTAREGIASLDPLLAEAATQPPTPGIAALQVVLAELDASCGRYREQLAAAERAAEMARAVGDEALLAQAEHWRGTALLTLGRTDEALPALEDVIPRTEHAGDLSSHALALTHVAAAHIQRGEFEQARAQIDRALAAAERRGDPAQTAFMTYSRGMLTVYTGDWTAARADFERAAAAMRSIGISFISAYPLLGLGHLCLMQGQWGEGARHLQEAITQAERSGDLQALRQAQMPLIERDLLEGRAEVARARLDRVLDRERTGWNEGIATMLTLASWVHLELGEEEQAETLLAQALERADAERHLLARVSALLVGIRLATQRQDWPEATRTAGEAIALSQTMPYPYNQARALYTCGWMHQRHGEMIPARQRLEAARAICARLGERLYGVRIEQALAELKVRPERG